MSVVLRWRAVPDAAGYELQIAEDPAFSRIEVNTRVKLPAHRWSVIPEVRYHWRVRSVDAAGRPGPWSEVRTIEPALDPPSLVAPADGARLALTGDRLQVTFRCAPSELLGRYRIEVARDEAFADVLASFEGEACWARLDLPGPGIYRWRVVGTTLLGKAGPPSAVRQVVVVLGAPVPLAPAGGALLPGGEVELRWAPIRSVARYRVRVERGGETVLRLDVPEPRAVVSLPGAGVFTWTVAALDGAGAPGPACAPRSFRLPERVPPPAPVALRPGGGAVVGVDDPASPVELAWDPVPGAARYELELVEGEAPRGAAAPPLAVTPPPGEVAWRVRAVDADGLAGPWSERASFVHGRPATARAQVEVDPPVLVGDGASSAEVIVRLVDAAGRPVSGAPLEITTSAGRVDGVTEGAGAYRTRFTPGREVPPGAAAELSIVDRGFRTTVRVPVRERPDRLFLGAGLGFTTNLQGLGSPAVHVDLAWRSPLLRGRLLLLARAGFHQASADVPLASGATTPAASRGVPLTLLALHEIPLVGFTLLAGAGPTLEIAATSVGGSSSVGVGPGALAAASLARPVGPGSMFLELSAGVAFAGSSLVELSAPRVSLLPGYRIRL